MVHGLVGAGLLLWLATSLAPLTAQVSWQRPEGQVRLTGRLGVGLAQDDLRSRTVLFGGAHAAGPTNETWEWDGTSWAQKFPPSVPPARHGHAMAFDALRGVVVVFGGAPGGYSSPLPPLADLWEYDGTTWTQRSFVGGPTGRRESAMTFDAVRGRIVMFGGTDGTALVPQNDAHWEWDGNAWTQGPSGPPSRSSASLVYDWARNRTVLYGGIGTCFAFSCPTFSDTWEFDGTSWTQRAVIGPTSRHSAMAAYDLIRSVVVVAGGVGGCQPACGTSFTDTWEWNGTIWTQRPVAAPRIQDGAMTFDAGNARCVAFGGIDTIPFHTSWLSAETYTFDGTTWTSAAPSPMPPARLADALAYDTNRREVIWFGNTTATSPGGPATFAFDGSRWQRLTTPVSPAARSNHAMVTDRARGRVVLFGGTAHNGTFLNDTWEWDGVQWIQMAPVVSPPPQYFHGMAYDSRRAVTVLYSGVFGRNEVYEYDGVNWTLRTFATMPPYRYYPAFAYDEARGNCVLFGGNLNQFQNDCWLYDGVQWTQDLSPVKPQARSQPRMAFDAARNRMVLFGGSPNNSTMLQDTWEWDGSIWSQRTSAGAPQSRSSQAMCYDEARGRIVMFGGYPGSGNFGYLHDTWELVTGCDRAGPGEVGGGGIPIACDSAPTRGQTFCLDYQNTNPNAGGLNFLLLTPGACSVAPPVVPVPPGCAPSFLYGLPTEVHFQVGAQASFCFAVPNQPVFLGAVLCFQGSALETTGCFRATDGLTAVVR